jgi:hypothetical protein
MDFKTALLGNPIAGMVWPLMFVICLGLISLAFLVHGRGVHHDK